MAIVNIETDFLRATWAYAGADHDGRAIAFDQGAGKIWVMNADGSNPRLPWNGASGGGSYRVLTTGRYHSCALTTANALLCWGANSAGALGNGPGRPTRRCQRR
jgi:hypothetical protein